MQKKHYAISIITVLILGWALWQILPHTANSPESTNQSSNEQKYESINGTLVSENISQQKPLAVVIENHPSSRPQSGLSDADLVYETLAEGGITRFLAIFQTKQIDKIGPVRSARSYFASIANSLNALFAHAGGSDQALAELSANKYPNLLDINQFTYGDYFNRDSSRQAPHNLYTSSQSLNSILNKNSSNNWNKIKLFNFKATATSDLKTEVTNITLPFSTDQFKVSYKFDPTTNSYLRSVNNQPQIDKNNNQQISTKNILVQLANITPNDDEKGTVDINLKTSGPCYLFHAGIYESCTWKYVDSKVIFTKNDGTDLFLEPGQTWIEIFPRNKQNEIKWN